MSKKTKCKVEYPRHWWFSCDKFTCYVATDEANRVMPISAPIVRRFSGQSIKNLVGFMKRIGGFMFEEYDKNRRAI